MGRSRYSSFQKRLYLHQRWVDAVDHILDTQEEYGGAFKKLYAQMVLIYQEHVEQNPDYFPLCPKTIDARPQYTMWAADIATTEELSEMFDIDPRNQYYDIFRISAVHWGW